MTNTEAIRLLEQFRAGGVTREQVLQRFQAAPVSDLGFAQVDTHRALRKGFPEVIFGAGKQASQIIGTLNSNNQTVANSPSAPAEASFVPMYAHLALVFTAGVYLPPQLVVWFQNVAKVLG